MTTKEAQSLSDWLESNDVPFGTIKRKPTASGFELKLIKYKLDSEGIAGPSDFIVIDIPEDVSLIRN